MKPDAFDFKSLPTFPVTTIFPPLSLHAFKKNNSESSLSLEEVREDEIKFKRNITHLNLSKVFDLSYFPQISILLSDSIFSTYI